MSRKTANPYLGEFELQRVLALIGYLATHKNQNGVTRELVQREMPPGPNGHDWLQIANAHPEFFFVYDGEKEKHLRLWARFQQDDSQGGQKRPPLEPDRIVQLQSIATQLHEAAIRFSDLRRNWYAFWISLVTGLAGGALGAALLSLWKGN